MPEQRHEAEADRILAQVDTRGITSSQHIRQLIARALKKLKDVEGSYLQA
jgi:hypothetical protein